MRVRSLMVNKRSEGPGGWCRGETEQCHLTAWDVWLLPSLLSLSPFTEGAEKGIRKRLDLSKAAFQLCTQTGNRKVQQKSSHLKHCPQKQNL